jgi:hypothetical protein
MLTTKEFFDSRPLYDDPPDSEEDDDDDEFESKPMPAEPPPPPPPELLFEDQGLGDYQETSEQLAYTGDNVRNLSLSGLFSKVFKVNTRLILIDCFVFQYSDSDHAYGIALYDYTSTEPGDLQFQVSAYDLNYESLARMLSGSFEQICTRS